MFCIGLITHKYENNKKLNSFLSIRWYLKADQVLPWIIYMNYNVTPDYPGLSGLRILDNGVIIF